MNKLDYDVDCLEISDDLISMAEDNTLGDFSHIDDELQFVKNDGSFFVIKKNNDNVKQSRPTVNISRTGPRSASDCPSDTNLNRKQRDDRRRANHNEIERRRRDKINNWIHELNKIIPAEHMNSPPQDPQANKQNGGTGDNLSKGGILAKACEYITRLKDTSDKLTECLAEKDQILLENLQLKESINQLLTENKRLQSELQFALATNVKIES
ncbi:upstream stimulatory factor 2-like isoform X5 [Topomyia yanbarensis]|uniref:upstream stimulatory factor 2-like isoform X5 n=1 Tax=Topomyia yanbarensis TaxID=2498891 RepID=UPI00273B70DE|nr:upstream stimulatory factor 2-like isoform X5 [Topomyia yanbarensis]